jgi:HPt (histidine-containing phosphotransfer) domain-containing protein
MEFKRLNNMTGKDPVLNRRIATIFLNDFQNFKSGFSQLADSNQLDAIQFQLHKIKPSLVIFELEVLSKQFEELLQQAKTGIILSSSDEKLVTVLETSAEKINAVKEYIRQIS